MNLKEYLKKAAISQFGFSLVAKIGTSTVFRILSDQKVSKKVAKKVVKATKGCVTLKDLGYENE